jgi:hypothetical protein
MDGVTVSTWFRLGNKPDRGSVHPGSLGIRGFIAGPDDNSNLLSPGGKGLLDQDAKQRFPVAFGINEGLER